MSGTSRILTEDPVGFAKDQYQPEPVWQEQRFVYIGAKDAELRLFRLASYSRRPPCQLRQDDAFVFPPQMKTRLSQAA